MIVRLSVLLFAAAAAPAQNANTLVLPDTLDLRPGAVRAPARIAELASEASLQTGLGNLATAAQITAVVTQLQAWQSGTSPIPAGAGLEFHVVGFYEGNGATSTIPGTASIEVDRPGTPVVLLLNAYESITWTLSQTPGTAVIAVISYSYEPQILVGLPGVAQAQLSYAVNNDGTFFGTPDDPTDPEARLRATQFCLERLGAFPATVTGDYAAPNGTYVVGDSNPMWRDHWVAARAITEGLTWNVGTRASLLGSVQGALFLPLFAPELGQPGLPVVSLAALTDTVQPMLVLPAGTTDYALGNGFQVFTLTNGVPATYDVSTAASTPIPTSPSVPPFSWVNTLTVDTLRNRLLVASFGGGGNLYAWDIATATWSLLSQPLEAPQAIVWHPTYDATFGLRIDHYDPNPFVLQRYDSNGALVSTVNLPLPVCDEFPENHQLHAVGPAVVLVGPSRQFFGFSVRQCFAVNPQNGDIVYAGFLLG